MQSRAYWSYAEVKPAIDEVNLEFEMMKRIDMTKLIITIGFIVALFLFWRYAYPCALAYHEQMQLFLWDVDYMTEILAEAGGFARYIAEMMVQNYVNISLGALLLSLLMLAMQQLAWIIQKRCGAKDNIRNYMLSFLIPMAVWALMGDKDVMTTFPIALALTLGMISLTPRNRKWAIVYSLLMVTVGYWLAGPLAIIGAIFVSSYMVIKSEDRLRQSFVAVVVTLVGALELILSCSMLPYPAVRVVRGIDYYREPEVCFPREWFTSDIYQQLDYSMLVRQQEWNKIIAKASGKMPSAPASVAAVRLAQWKKHIISNEQMTEFVSIYSNLDNPTNILMKSDLYYYLGMVNASRRFAFEFKQLIGNNNQSGRIIRRLAEVELVSGHFRLARKYLYLLRKTTYYRVWAEKTLPMTYNPRLIEEHPVYGPLSKSFPESEPEHSEGAKSEH